MTVNEKNNAKITDTFRREHYNSAYRRFELLRFYRERGEKNDIRQL